MSTNMIHGASSSMSTSSSSRRSPYDVFLSFYGKDTRKNFTDHLFTALVQDGIRTFRDDEELEKGEDISSELMDAIEGSMIAIVVFSQNYASSGWCLNELVKILKCKKSGRTVIPIFYNVDPSDVRHQKNTFAEAIVKHEERLKEEIGKVESWKDALTEAANLSGWDHLNVANGYESELIKRVVEEVSRIVNQTPLHVATHQVGLDSHIKRITCLLNDGLDVRFIGIHGLGGIGKTTIAKAVFNDMFKNFEGSSFLANVREASSKQNGLANLQKQLLSDVLKRKHEDISNEDRGISIIQKRLCSKRVLIVLDDVDEKKQLDKLVGEHGWLGRGSRIIITTRDEHLLNILKVDERCKVETMNENESLQLFSLHAFRQDQPLEGYFQLSSDIVRYTDGLPLALVVLGSLLSDKRSQVEWENELEKLRKIPNNQILKILEISYDALDDSEQHIFLDISCFFIGMFKDGPILFLDACGLHPEVGIKLLIEKSLLTIDEKNNLSMHDLIQDMGREIVRKQSLRKPGERSRLWQYDDALDVLRNLTGTNAVECLQVDSIKPPYLRNLTGTATVEFFQVDSIKRSLDPDKFGDTTVKEFQLTTNTFFKMPDLRLLRIGSPISTRYSTIGWVHCLEGQNFLFKNLIWFSWWRFPFNYIPNNFHLGNLIILDMTFSEDLKELWKGTKDLPKLKVLSLSYCTNLTCTPDFSGLPNLRILNLCSCHSLVGIHESIGHLSKLIQLNLSFCENISTLPNSIGKLASLEEFDISFIGQLKNLPEGVRNWTRLSVFRAYACRSLKILPNLSSLKHLRILDLSQCQKLNVIEGFEGLKSVETIKVYGCNNLTGFTLHKMFQVISEDLRNPNICDICLPGRTIDDWFDLPTETVLPLPFCLVIQVPNIEIQGVMIGFVSRRDMIDGAVPVVVVHNQSKNVTWKHNAIHAHTERIQTWLIKIPQCVWKSIAECGDIIQISVNKDERRSVLYIGANFYTSHGKVSHTWDSGP